MNQDSKEKNKKIESRLSGPGDDCNCPVCIFTKSQAPGNPYDLKDCPRYNSSKSSKNQDKKTKQK